MTPQTRKAAMIWKHLLTPIAKKIKVMPQVREIMAIVFGTTKVIVK